MFEFPILVEKSISISVKTFFFFLETTCFWAEKTFEFPSFPRNSVSIFGQTERNCFKNNENSGQGCLHFSYSFKKAPPPPPPPFSKSWLRACCGPQSLENSTCSDESDQTCNQDFALRDEPKVIFFLTKIVNLGPVLKKLKQLMRITYVSL